jgi:hypothetical protein
MEMTQKNKQYKKTTATKLIAKGKKKGGGSGGSTIDENGVGR